MNDQQLLRYSRQIMLPQIGIEGQDKIIHSTVAIIGLGGLGSPVSMYLAAAGVGTLILCDDDVVDLSNLQRQIIHSTDAIGQKKTTSASARLKTINPEIQVQTLDRRANEDEISSIIGSADIVVDGTDNFSTRFMINRACIAAKKPLVSGAVIRMEGQLSVFDPGSPDTPCYQCLYVDNENEIQETCSETGVLAPVAGIIGSLQATETLKMLSGTGSSLIGKLLLVDALTMEFRTIRLPKDPACPACSEKQRN